VCRKVITAKLSGQHEIEIWGDGAQTRSFMYIDDCLYARRLCSTATIVEPINIGRATSSFHQRLVDIVERSAE